MSTDSHTGLRALVPDWMREYRAAWLTVDVIAGLTAGAIVIPKAMAYAAIVASLFKPAAAATPTGHPDREHPGGDG